MYVWFIKICCKIFYGIIDFLIMGYIFNVYIIYILVIFFLNINDMFYILDFMFFVNGCIKDMYVYNLYYLEKNRSKDYNF